MAAVSWIKTAIYEANGTPIALSLDGEIGTQVKDKLTGLIWIKTGSGLIDWTLFSTVLAGSSSFDISDTLVTGTNVQATLSAIVVPADSVLLVDVLISAKKDTDPLSESAGYKIFAVFENSSGAITQIGSTEVLGINEDNVSLDVTMDVSAPWARIRVTGLAATMIQWYASGRTSSNTF